MFGFASQPITADNRRYSTARIYRSRPGRLCRLEAIALTKPTPHALFARLTTTPESPARIARK